MAPQDLGRKRTERFLAARGEELGRGARFVRFHVQLWRFCARRLWENNVTAMSAALSFRTIFAMVPAIVLAVMVLKSVGVLEDSRRSLREFLAALGVEQIIVIQEGESAATSPAAGPTTAPARSINLVDEIEAVIAKVEAKLTFGRVGPVGVALLIWTAVSLLTTMERSLNRIFDTRRSRSLARRLPLYWATLTLGPLLLAVSAYAGRKLTQVSEDIPGVSTALAIFGRAEAVIVGILVVAAVYKFLPNTSVRYRSAFGGALVCVPLWMVARWGFSVYVIELVGTGNLYGALGLLPLFFIWLNLSWLIFLFGAQLAYTAANLDRLQLAERAAEYALGPADLLAASIAVAQPFLVGRGPVGISQIARRLSLPDASAEWLLDRLGASGIVCRVGGEADASYVLARPAEKISVLEILELDRRDGAVRQARSYDHELVELVSRTRDRAQSALGTFTLADVMAAGGGADERAEERTPLGRDDA